MAQHPFAAVAREKLKAQGIVFLPDGSTMLNREESIDGNVDQQVVEKLETNEVGNTELGNHDTGNHDTGNPEVDNTDGPVIDERDKILALQREEIADLKAKLAQSNTQQSSEAPPHKSAREAELEKEIEDLKAKISTQTIAEQADEVRALLEQQGFDSEVLDDEALLEIRDRFIKPMANKLDHLENAIKKYEDKLRDPTPEEKLASIKQDTNKKIVGEIPDFNTIFNSKDFQKRLAEKDNRFPTKTYGEALQIAYENGNADFIVQEVKNFLGGGPAQNIEKIADVSASKGGGGNGKQSQGKPRYTFTNEEAIQMLRKRQMGDLTKQEYSEYRQKLEAKRSRSS